MKLNYKFETKCVGYNQRYEEFYYEEEDFEYEISNAELNTALVNIVIENYKLKGKVNELFSDLALDNDYLLDLVDEEEIKEYFYEKAFDKWKENQDYYDHPTTY